MSVRRLSALGRLPAMLALSLCASAGAFVLAAPPAHADPQDRELAVWFAEGTQTLRGGTRVENSGTAAVDGTVRTRNGGKVLGVDGPWGPRAFQLPDFATWATPSTIPIAVVTFGGSGDSAWQLNPGTSDFGFGSSFRLDADGGSSWVDNGDNLVQRGLWGAPSQYKIQLDRGRPSCRVKGADGAVMVDGDYEVPRGRWFNVRCERDARGVTMTLGGRLADDSYVFREWRSVGRTGSMWGLDGDVPLSIGGKVDDSGEPMVADSDQFNGAVDNVWVDIDR